MFTKRKESRGKVNRRKVAAYILHELLVLDTWKRGRVRFDDKARVNIRHGRRALRFAFWRGRDVQTRTRHADNLTPCKVHFTLRRMLLP